MNTRTFMNRYKMINFYSYFIPTVPYYLFALIYFLIVVGLILLAIYFSDSIVQGGDWFFERFNVRFKKM